MKITLLTLLVITFASIAAPSAHAGPYHTLILALPTTLPTITVPANKVLTIVTFAQSYGPSQSTYLQITGVGANIFFYATTQPGTGASDAYNHGPEGITVAGPATITFTLNNQSGVLFTYKLQAN